MNLPINPDTAVSFLRRELHNLQAVYFYGSVVTAELTRESDIDIAVKPGESLDNVTRWRLQERLATELGRDVDLLDLDKVSLVMKFEVISKGVLVYSHEGFDVSSFETLIYSLYLDFNDIRRPIIDTIQERGSVYGDG